MQCKNCGEELVSGAEFCIKCGTKIKGKNNSPKRIMLISALILIIIAIISIAFYMKTSKESLNADSLQLLSNEEAKITQEELLEYVKIYQEHIKLIESGKEHIEIVNNKEKLKLIADKFGNMIKDTEFMTSNKELAVMYLDFYELTYETALASLNSYVVEDGENGEIQLGNKEQLEEYCNTIQSTIDKIKEKYYK